MPRCEVNGIESIQRLAIFDNLKFTNDLHRIKFLELASDINNNYMILAIDGTIYKYDLASKELLFQFKTVIYILIYQYK